MDRGAWETPAITAATTNPIITNYSFNVTYLVQQDILSGISDFSFLLSALGGMLECAKDSNATAAYKPVLHIESQNQPHGSGASAVADFAEDGMPLMSNNFILAAETLPTLSYKSLVGEGVEFQLSLSEDFRNVEDLDWVYSTMNDPFATTSTTGSYTIPATDELTNGTIVNYRYRAIDNTSKLSDWALGDFLLPGLDVVDNRDGTATMVLYANDLNLSGYTLIEDAVVNSALNIADGTNSLLTFVNSPTSESLLHTRLNLQYLGISSTSTILDAKLILTRNNNLPKTPMLSMHTMSNTGWVENEVTWNLEQNGIPWNSGGKDSLGRATDTGISGAQANSNFEFDFQHLLESEVSNGVTDPLEFTINGLTDSQLKPSTNELVEFFAKEDFSPNSPRIYITYEQEYNSSVPDPILESPINGAPVWKINGHNLSGDETPDLVWNATVSPSMGVIFQLANDSLFRDIIVENDARTQNPMLSSQGQFSIPQVSALDKGKKYYWRMSHFDGDNKLSDWEYGEFLVSSLTSTYISGDRHQIEIRLGTEALDTTMPVCKDISLTSAFPTSSNYGAPYIATALDPSQGTNTGLFQCDLRNYLLPDGYAVESASVSMELYSQSLSPTVGIWEGLNHEWVEQEATWNNYDSTNIWDVPGANGQDRGSLLDSVSISPSASTYEWNITSAAQNAMRDGTQLDLIMDIRSTSSGSQQALFKSHYDANSQNYPTITIVYIPGSNQLPDVPSAVSPLNDEWVYTDDYTLTPDVRPTLEWATSGTVPVSGWSIEMDLTPSFNSISSVQYTSWNDAGFDVAGNSFTPQSDLLTGETWYWRVRALSATNQLGAWSSAYQFNLPSLTTTTIDDDHFIIELEHESAMPSQSIPSFTDTYLVDSASTVFQTNHSSEADILVGTTNQGDNASGLIRISLDQEIQPANSRIVDATLSLYSSPISTQGTPIAVRPVLLPWLNNASYLTYNGTGTWNENGGRGIGTDIGEISDIQMSTVGWMTWNITEIAQQAMANSQPSISLMLYNVNPVADRMVYFSSSEAFADKPKLQLTWANGSVAPPTDQPNIISPALNDIVLDSTSHALLPDLRPEFSWDMPTNSQSNPDAWRIAIDIDPNDEMQGKQIFDSRVSPSLFDLNQMTFTPDIDISYDNKIQWTVQPVESDMLGMPSNGSVYWIPSIVGEELNPTDASLSLQDGNMVNELNLPQLTQDTYMDEGAPNTANNLNGLSIGNSSVTNANTDASTAVVSFDLSKIQMPSIYEIMSASLTLSATGGSGIVDVSASALVTHWDETATWNNNTAGNPWINPGALRGADSEIPDDLVQVNALGDYTWNITRIMQHAIASGNENISVLLQPEIAFTPSGLINGNYLFADSESTDISKRPKLELVYRTVNPWVPVAPTTLTPADGATLWNTTSPTPIHPESIEFTLTNPNTNVTEWTVCHGEDIRWLDCFSSSEFNPDYNWDSASSTFNYSATSEIASNAGDVWQNWRVRGDQDYRIGYYSQIHQYRTSPPIGTNDGQGNYSLELSRGSIFDTTGSLPSVSDASIDALDLTNTGSDNSVIVGYSSVSTGTSSALFEFDISEIPFPLAATPTEMTLQLDLVNPSGNQNPMTIAVYPCATFDESLVDYSTAPVCSQTEITRTTITGSSGSTIEWDISALGQANFAQNNMTITVKLEAVNSGTNSYEFHTSESSNNQPKLLIDYVDNQDGVIPPQQPNLVSPTDGSILYDTTGDTLQIESSVSLTWSASAGASAYKVYISDFNTITVFDSRVDPEISGTTFTPSSTLTTGVVYEWWVQAINQTIPGPSSARWNFALGNPDHTYNNDGTYSYIYQDSTEVPDYSHVDVRDTMITDAFGDINYGSQTTMALGGGCNTVAGSQCYGIVSLDASQIPLDSTKNVHSVDLTLFVQSWDLSGGAYEIDFTVHEFLFSNWNENTLTWNNTGPAPGPVAGVDYVSTPIDSRTYTTTTMQLSFQIAMDGMSVDDEKHWLIIATPVSSGGTFDGFVRVHSSETFADSSKRPKFELRHTNISSLDLTPQSATFDADTPIVIDVAGLDNQGTVMTPALPVGANIEWSTTTGSISPITQTSASLIPTISGQQTVTACYGIICEDYVLNIQSGMPVQLFASFDSANIVTSTSINADQSADVYAYAIDQHGNLVTGQTITYSVSNGSMLGSTFYPYSVGTHIVSAQWSGPSNTLTQDLSVTVSPGQAQTVELSGCDIVVNADTTCDLYATVFDQYDNLVWFDEVGTYSLSSTNGQTEKLQPNTPHSQPPQANVLIGRFTGHDVGTWAISITTDAGLTDLILVEVSHGAMASLELNASASTITADEVVYLNTTRIDVRGNRLPVSLPAENWTSIADGQLQPGITAIWTPQLQGSKQITATYQGFTETVNVFVTRGLVTELYLKVDGVRSNEYQFNLTTDDSLTVMLEVEDAKGNIWQVPGNWTISHPQIQDNSVLSNLNSAQTTFNPTDASNDNYLLTGSYTENGITQSSYVTVLVSVGDLDNFIVSAQDQDGVSYNDVTNFDITADGFITFDIQLSDSDSNALSTDLATWIMVDQSDGSQTDITQEINQNSLQWLATLVGDWSVFAYAVNNNGNNFSEHFDITVSHGIPVNIQIAQSASTQDAGDIVTLEVIGTDSDGNQFPQVVTWLENNGSDKNINATANEGEYEFNGRVAGIYQLEGQYLALTQIVSVEVFPQSSPSYIKFNVSKESLEQLESLKVTVEAFDEYWNQIPVPSSSEVEVTGRGDVSYQGDGIWNIETLDEGDQIGTITVGTISESFEYRVDGNLAGFFAAGGPLYYVGAGLISLLIIALLVFVVRFFRGDEDYYDDDEDEDFDYDVESSISSSSAVQTPTLTAMPPSKPVPIIEEPQQEPEEIVEEEYDSDYEEDNSWMADYRVEEDGTEWGQTDEGIWYYREPDQDDWTEWVD